MLVRMCMFNELLDVKLSNICTVCLMKSYLLLQSKNNIILMFRFGNLVGCVGLSQFQRDVF